MAAPKGNQYAKRKGIAQAALKKALAIESGVPSTETTETFQALIDIWTKQIELAKEGSTQSANMIIERLDGRARQEVDQTISAGEGVSFNMSFVAQDKKE